MTTVPFRLIDHGWVAEFVAAAQLEGTDLLIISPFIKDRTLRRLVDGRQNTRVLTRFSLRDFSEGVSDLAALRRLLQAGAEVRGIKNLHAKLYVFGDARAILTSANLTEAALTRNHELGLVTEDPGLIQACRDYFEGLWALTRAKGHSLTTEQLEAWGAEIDVARREKATATRSFCDHGVDLGFLPDPPPTTIAPSISKRAFVKFFGTSRSRAERSTPVFEEVRRSESHWSLSYPKGKRPRQPKTGDVMFIARIVRAPNDIMIYGRAVGYTHKPGRDDASEEDINRVPDRWKAKWCHYIRVRDPEFIAGTLKNGISLCGLMDEFKERSFASTEANARKGSKKTDPRRALMRKAQVLLSQTAGDWLNARFNRALAEHGRIPTAEIEKLYWPEPPSE